MALLVGTVAVAALALLVAGWIAIGGARPGEEEAVAETRTTGGDPAVAAIATVERRAMRRARLRASDDPILAALGLSEADPAAEPAPDLEGRLPRRTQRVNRKR
jgi:hypothetical protein